MSTVAVANTQTNILGKTMVMAEKDQTITGLQTFDRDPSAPFAVSSGSAVVTNLDADKLDGQEGAYYLSATNLSSGTLPVARLGNGTNTVVSSSTATNQDNWAPGLVGNTTIFWSGASSITITGFAGGVSGQIITFLNTGSNVATFAHQSSSSSAGNKLRNLVTSGSTPVAANGYAVFAYDGTDWRMIAHEQGSWITPTFAAGDYTASGSQTFTVASGDVTQAGYRLSGRTLTVSLWLNTLSVGGTPSTELRILVPGGFTIARKTILPCSIVDSGTAALGNMQVNTATSTTKILVTRGDGGNWTASTDNTAIFGEITFEVT